MTTTYAKAAKRTKMTPQTMPIRGKKMIRNDAGGYNFEAHALQRVRRFVILGTTGNTYYVSEQKLTEQNVDHLVAVFKTDDHGPQAVEMIAEISDQGLAPKVSPALFALALAFDGSLATKRMAARKFSTIVRTHSHMLEFVSYADELRGWGSMLKRTVANWYSAMGPEKLAYQLAKYQNRSGWTTRDVLRMAHPYPSSGEHDAIYAWACGKEGKTEELRRVLPGMLPGVILGMEEAKTTAYEKRARHIIQYGLTREMVPTEWLNDIHVWEALLQNMPLTALIRNLPKLTTVGVISPFSTVTSSIVQKITDPDDLKRSRIHPLNVLVALLTYKKGRGHRGNLSWSPVAQIVTALEKAYYMSFENVEPTGKNYLIGVDISGSMTMGFGGGIITAHEAAAGLAMVIARTEPNYYIMGFGHTFVDLGITADDSLESALLKTQGAFGATDCSVPVRHAIKRDLDVDAFVIITDGNTWVGNEHPVQTLARYNCGRRTPAKMIQIATEANNGSLGEGENCLDICGFDPSMMAIINEFMNT